MGMKKVVLKWNSGARVTSVPLTGSQVEKAVRDGREFYVPDSHEVVDMVDPTDGGCWFCSTATDEMVFDTEFDTNLHKQCLIQTLQREPNHPEARLMVYLLEEENDSEEDLPL